MKHALRAVAASVFGAVAILLLSYNTYFAQLNYAAYDFTLRLAGPIKPSSPTIIVAIDEESLARVGAWIWSRDKLARIIERVESGRPRTIAVDVILDERTNEKDDLALSEAVRKARSVVLAAHLDQVDNESYWRKPNEDLLLGNVRLGHVHADPDFDGIARRIYSAKIGGSGVFSAFSIEALRSANLPINGDFEIRTGEANVLRPMPVNIRYIGDIQSFTHVPAWEVLEGRTDVSVFKDKIVLIGATAEGIGDQWFTPFAESGRRMSGIEIHANAIETIYAGRAMSEVSDLTVLLALIFFIALLTW
ncbi:MAG: CHASE2 domain-containing protein, partial [Acidobacteria bacterium]|nr:CHASE2 domain-containing protein [Acidobacteriota bacterium]